ncbi:MAG TPA: TIGR04282 family arsenosugar biosynthesis glycosyltransferase [Rubricoccaceae bacterium]|nr:TIGR04282 family arsenosugar biosynthesis glycosyltransferase [Rubricoccaceae bacterium]
MPDRRGTGAAALIVFAKAPTGGGVKTRLVPPLTPAEAAALADAFLRDGLARYAAPGAFGEAVAVRLYLAGEGDLPPDVAPEGVSLHRQRGDGLGARMERAFVETFAGGYGRAVIVGTDHPTLPLDFLAEAFRALEAPRTAVIGPSDDGGYYALGLNDLPFGAPGLFAMDYSHAGVFDATLDRVLDAGLSAVVLPPWYDVDDAADLRRLLADWRAGADVPAHTAASLKALLDAYPALL